ncbi:MAG: SurA N-terminal domain-containing protein, partial [bacterium]
MQNSEEGNIKNRAKKLKGLRGLVLSFVGITIILATGSWLLHHLQPTTLTPLPQSWREASNRIILKVNGQVATEREWVIQYQRLRQDPKNAAKLEQEIKIETLANLIRNKVLLSEALKKGFQLDEGEARAYTEEQQKALKSAGANSEDRVLLDKFLQGLGVSEEEYWREIAPQMYLLLLPQMHLKEDLHTHFPPLTPEELDLYKRAHPEWENLSE